MDDWTLIVGLGNPGGRYEQTRHNAGFMVIDRLAQSFGCSWSVEKKFSAQVAKPEGHRLILCKPQTYMNLSGESVASLQSFYRIALARLLVVVDDADLPLGTIRMRPKGSSGGHHGLDSVNQHLGSTDYARLKVGIGRNDPTRREIVGHVLGRFAADEEKTLDLVLKRGCDQVHCWLERGIEKAMNQYNGTVDVPEAEEE